MSKYKEVSLSELTTPKTGYEVIVDGWWLTQNGNPLMFMLHGVHPCPQYNSDKRLVEMRLKNNPQFDMLFIPIAYIPKRN